METYKLATDEDFIQFEELVYNNQDWSNIHTSSTMNLTVHRKQSVPTDIFKVRCEMPDVEPETLYNVLHDHNYRKTWDKNMIEGIVIDLLNPSNEIGYYSAKFPTPVSNRDFVNQRAWVVKGDRWIIINWSVKHKDYPEKSDYVRAVSILSGYHIEKRDGGGLVFTYITQSDIKGWIPVWITNKLIGKFVPNTAHTLHRVAIEYPEWKKDNHPDWMPWYVVPWKKPALASEAE
jgi:hypothetical protein